MCTDKQGVFMPPNGEAYQRLCEAAVRPDVGVCGVAVQADDACQWLVATLSGRGLWCFSGS